MARSVKPAAPCAALPPSCAAPSIWGFAAVRSRGSASTTSTGVLARSRCVTLRVVRQAYARAGLPYTRSHLLRHTMANRLLAGGSSLKEVADVLRHRSLNTTLIYAKLDSRKLVAVALPWPGSAA